MKWSSAIATPSHLGDAVLEAAETVAAGLNGTTPDLVLAFVSGEYADHFSQLPRYLREHFPSATLIGCSAGGVIGGGRELEQQPCLSLTAAVLPDVRVEAFHLGAAGDAWPEEVGLGAGLEPELVILADPYTCDAEALVAWLDQAYPNSTKVGGLASGATQAGESALFCNDEVHRTGAVGIALSGNIEVDTVVAQGCRPIGHPMFVTRSHGRVLLELDGQPALSALELLHTELSESDRELFRHSLHVGVVMRDERETYEHGDFLIRNIVGIDPQRSAVAVAHDLRRNQVVQFHLRDATTSTEDLSERLTRHQYARPSGALLFSCLGRGKHLYGEEGHDSGLFRQHIGEVALGGFFCNGEIGPEQGKTFLHGYTSSFALFRPKHP